MSGRVIYRCGRFLDQGYTTLRSDAHAPPPAGVSDEDILNSLREGRPAANTAGRVWSVISEGRKVVEILAYIHDGPLPKGLRADVDQRLEALATQTLPDALAKATASGLAPSAARRQLTNLLQDAAAEISGAIVTAAPTAPRSRRAPRQGGRMLALTACAAITIVAGASWAFVNLDRFRIPFVTKKPTVEAVLATAQRCYPDTTQGEVESLAGVAIADLPMPPDGLDPAMICESRQTMWHLAEELRTNHDEFAKGLNAARQHLAADKHDLPALKLMDAVHSRIGETPIPEQPIDCAHNRCLPFMDDRDEALRLWVVSAYEALDLLAPDTNGHSTLRAAEVELRGELSLAREMDVAHLPSLFKSLWSCGPQPDCTFPLREATGWLPRK